MHEVDGVHLIEVGILGGPNMTEWRSNIRRYQCGVEVTSLEKHSHQCQYIHII